MTATATDAGPARPGIGWRLLRLFRRGTRPEVPPVNVLDGFTFITPARDDAFPFSVTVSCCWCASGGHDSTALRQLIDERRPLDERVIRRVIRSATRVHEPYDAKGAEEAANKALQDEGDRALSVVSRDGRTATCSAWVEIELTDQVRLYQQREWRARLRLEAHRSASRRTIQTLAELRDHWLVFLGADPADLKNDWRVPFAIRLAEHGQQVTETVASMHWRRRRDVTFAVGFYNDVIKQCRNAGQYDFASAVEDSLNKMVKAYNLPRYDLVGEMLQKELMPYTESDPMAHVFGLRPDQESAVSDPGPEMFGTGAGEAAGYDGVYDGQRFAEEPEDFWPDEEPPVDQREQDADERGGPEPGDSEEPPEDQRGQDAAGGGSSTGPPPPSPNGHPGHGGVPRPRPDESL
ncbi:hypothetical protein AB0K12_03460 [Nonomuraea sp. NPDC049419]|uniref:hypothetical protein n=1 Tax=Nonomuraea sp. NPDC049419 TaxID=3155772 RepID=UPI0034214EC7